MKRHNPHHLMILLSGILICIIKLLISPSHNKQVAVTLLPERPISPAGWSLQHQESIAPTTLPEQYNNLVAVRKYAFSSEGHQLLLELREIGNTNGDLQALQAKYAKESIGSAFEIKQTHKGEYYQSQQFDQVELQTCVHRSHLSVTDKGFREQAYRKMFQLQHLQNWFSGNSALVNDRCLWVKATVKPAIPTEKIESLLMEIASIN
jgi:cyanosortase A-associated protein